MSEDLTKVDPMDSAKNNSDVVESVRGQSTVMIKDEKSMCYWNDVEFPEGSKVCDNGVTYECQMARWIKLDEEC